MSAARIVNLTRRLAGAATLLLQLGVATAAPFAEAAAQDRSAGVVVHVESEGRESCPPPHDHLICPICRHIEARFSRASSPARTLPQQVVRFDEPSVREASPGSRPALGVLQARAPPTV